MTSVALRRLGHNIRILERSPTPLLHDQGAGIVAGGEIPTFMEQYDRTKTPFVVTSNQRIYLDKKGNVTQRENKEQHMTSWDVVYHICRANFDRTQSSYTNSNAQHDLPEEGTSVYQHGVAVTEVEEDGEGLKVSYKSTLPGEENKDQQVAKADFVIIADGSSSKIRKQLCPSSSERTYAGYVAFRGTIPEGELSKEAAAVFIEKFPFFHSEHTQILGYTIPNQGDVTPGKRLVNWVWYVNVKGDSDEYRQIMTDTTGTTHRLTLPAGGHMQPKVWEARKADAAATLPPQFAELVEKTKSPFVQAITDLEVPADRKCWRLGGKAVLVGDALAGFRPHTAASTAQAALHALTLARVFGGELNKEAYQDEVMEFATRLQEQGVFLGNRSQFGEHPLAD